MGSNQLFIPMDTIIVAGIIFILTGVLLLVAGHFIRNRGMTYLLSGYRADRVADEAGLAEFAGGTIMLMGYGTVMVGILMALFTDFIGWLALVDTVIIVGGTVYMMLGSRRYMKASA